MSEVLSNTVNKINVCYINKALEGDLLIAY